MKLSESIRKACADMHVKMSELARKTDQSPQNLSMKLKRDSISFHEFQKFMEIMNIQVDLTLRYPDGSIQEMPIADERVRQRIANLEAGLKVEQDNVTFYKRMNADMRMALYNVQGYVEMALRAVGDDERLTECLKKVKISGEKMNSLFDSSIYPDRITATHRNVEIEAEMLKGKRVLLVEDNEMNREITRDILEENGLITESCVDGKSAVRMVRQSRPDYYDIILMDIQMPEMDGIEATKQIRAIPNRQKASLPIIAMTGCAYEEDRRRSLEAGMNAHLTKPVDATQLIQTIADNLPKQ